MAARRNGIGVLAGGPRTNLSQQDLDYLYGRDGAYPAGDVTYGGPVPDLTPRQALRGSIDETAPALRGTLGPQDNASGPTGAPQLRGTISPSITTASGGPLPVGKGFAQAVYERALGAGLTDTQARLVASQAALESNHGRSGLSQNDNNFFGVKAGSSWTGLKSNYRTREEDSSGGSYYTNAPFRKYATPEDSFKDHLALLQRRYPDALAAGNINDATAGLRYGQQGGYATDQRYGAKIASIARGLRAPGSDPDNPTGIRPPASIPDPMGNGGMAQRTSNVAPPEVMQAQAARTNDLVDRHQLTGTPQSYAQTGPYVQQNYSPARVQDFFQPTQVQGFQPVQQNAFSGGGDDLASFFGLDSGGGGDFGGLF